MIAELHFDTGCPYARPGHAVLSPPTDSIATMTVIDDIYRAAGLRP